MNTFIDKLKTNQSVLVKEMPRFEEDYFNFLDPPQQWIMWKTYDNTNNQSNLYESKLSLSREYTHNEVNLLIKILTITFLNQFSYFILQMFFNNECNKLIVFPLIFYILYFLVINWKYWINKFFISICNLLSLILI